MAYRGQILDNPVSGERIVFRETAADTGGELLAIDLTLAPDGHVPGTHVHPEQEERFEVVSGAMKFRLGFRTVHAGPGDSVVVAPGVRHRFSNDGAEPAEVRVEVRPALRMEELLQTTEALAREGRTTRTGMPKPLELALLVREFQREVRAPFPPPWVVRLLMAPLVAPGGRDARYALRTDASRSRPPLATVPATPAASEPWDRGLLSV